MTHENDFRNIETLREKANVTYEEAIELLNRHDGSVMQALIDLERQGRVYSKPYQKQQEPYCAQDEPRQKQQEQQASQSQPTFFQKLMRTRMVVERVDTDGHTETVANLGAPFIICASIAAPWLAAASVGVAYATGHTININKAQKD